MNGTNTRMAGTTRLLAGLCLGAALAGCGGQGKVPDESYYRLSVPATRERSARPLGGVLVVNRFLADGLVSERALVYADRSTPHALRQYHYQFWADPPPRMVQEVTVDAFRAAGVASTVVTPEVRTPADYELNGKIRRLDYLRGESPQVVVELEFVVNRLRDGELVWMQSLSATREVGEDAPAAAVAAMSDALAEILDEAVVGLSAP